MEWILSRRGVRGGKTLKDEKKRKNLPDLIPKTIAYFILEAILL
jgi:hypothetical protein